MMLIEQIKDLKNEYDQSEKDKEEKKDEESKEVKWFLFYMRKNFDYVIVYFITNEIF